MGVKVAVTEALVRRLKWQLSQHRQRLQRAFIAEAGQKAELSLVEAAQIALGDPKFTRGFLDTIKKACDKQESYLYLTVEKLAGMSPAVNRVFKKNEKINNCQKAIIELKLKAVDADIQQLLDVVCRHTEIEKNVLNRFEHVTATNYRRIRMGGKK